MNNRDILEVYDKITNIFYQWEDWKLDENKLEDFLKIGFRKLNIDISQINNEDQLKLFTEFIKFFDYKLLDKVEKLFQINLEKNCIDKLWNSMFKKYIDRDWKDTLLFFSKEPYCASLNIESLSSRIDKIWKRYENEQFIKKIIRKEEITLDELKSKLIDSDPTSNN